jgi:hypothetical protein
MFTRPIGVAYGSAISVAPAASEERVDRAARVRRGHLGHRDRGQLEVGVGESGLLQVVAEGHLLGAALDVADLLAGEVLDGGDALAAEEARAAVGRRGDDLQVAVLGDGGDGGRDSRDREVDRPGDERVRQGGSGVEGDHLELHALLGELLVEERLVEVRLPAQRADRHGDALGVRSCIGVARAGAGDEREGGGKGAAEGEGADGGAGAGGGRAHGRAP